MIIVTGGAGFIGSNLVKALNARGEKDIVVVDDLTDGHKFKNLLSLEIADYWDKDEFLARIDNHSLLNTPIRAIFHEGACSATTEWDGRYMMTVNYAYSKRVLHFALEAAIPFLYASSAAVYGGNHVFKEHISYEAPLNVYGFSKWQFDQYVRRLLPKIKSQVVGLRYFNVYGPHEDHKGSMASVALHHFKQIHETGVIKLFAGCAGYTDGEQRRDFVFVDDVVNVNLWLMDHPEVNGIFNCGTGASEPFNHIARAILKAHGAGELLYVPFPAHLVGHYQSFTEADISALRAVGYEQAFTTVAEGVAQYYAWLKSRK